MVFDPTPVDLAQSRDRRAHRAVDRALSDVRRGEMVLLASGRGDGPGAAWLVLAVETAGPERLDDLRAVAAGPVGLLITGRRARVLGLDSAVGTAIRLEPADGLTLDWARDLADPTRGACGLTGPVTAREMEGAAGRSALHLVKMAQLLPAALIAPMTGDPAELARLHDLILVQAADVADYGRQSARTLHHVVEAAVPLAGAERTRLIAFRPSDGGAEHLAILIGDPAPDQPVLARLHSECFTGDLLESLRCDCGPQLRRAIEEIARAGSGVLLYLAQEGRGIGLMNKLRAYRLQDGGLDTLDANEALGFEADERIFLPAAAMLKSLGFQRVRLMTNNPDKLGQLAACGIEVVERVPHIFPSNGHNEAYLQAKSRRAGHLF